MKICAMSDLHGDLPSISPCELVLICGDIVPLNIQISSKLTYKWFSTTFKEWAEGLPCNKVVFIAGNHELGLVNHYKEYKSLFNNDSKVTYLCHEKYLYVGANDVYNIFGTPYCKSFGNWAFMLPNGNLIDKYSEIPKDLDILITHDQPYAYGDIILQEDCPWATGESIGNRFLTMAIMRTHPKYQFNGHLHSCDHNKIIIDKTIHYNVSLKDEKYQMVYDPLYLDITSENHTKELILQDFMDFKKIFNPKEDPVKEYLEYNALYDMDIDTIKKIITNEVRV